MITQVRAQSSSICILDWDAIPNEHHRGVLQGYRIVYTVSNDALDSSNVTVGVALVSHNVQGLRPHTKYLLKVAGFTSKGDGNYSAQEECQTLEDG